MLRAICRPANTICGMAKAYLGLTKRAVGPNGGSPIHLVREDAEASLCASRGPHSVRLVALTSSSAPAASTGSRGGALYLAHFRP